MARLANKRWYERGNMRVYISGGITGIEKLFSNIQEKTNGIRGIRLMRF